MNGEGERSEALRGIEFGVDNFFRGRWPNPVLEM